MWNLHFQLSSICQRNIASAFTCLLGEHKEKPSNCIPLGYSNPQQTYTRSAYTDVEEQPMQCQWKK